MQFRSLLPFALLAMLLPALVAAQADKVDVDMFVMSKCPDAAVCQRTFAEGLGAVADIMNFNIRYIASLTDSDDLKCPHGATECEGDMQQLCARNLTSRAAQNELRMRQRAGMPSRLPDWYNFVLCQSNDMYSIPKNGEKCAYNTGLPWSAISACVNNGQGEALLRDSITHIRTKDDKISCTINLDRELFCQHNGGWVGCKEGNTSAALVAAVCKRFKGASKPAVCNNLAHDTLQASTLHASPQPQQPAPAIALA